MRNLHKGLLPLSLLAFLFVFACNNDDDGPTTVDSDPIASFQFEVDATDFLMVSFTNFSQNATDYSWDFGDGNTSTDESPSHTYATGGTYTVVLTASNAAGVEATKSESITVSDPDEALTLLAGVTSKEWIMQREGAVMYVGPSQTAYDGSWYTLSENHADRLCVFDDVYTFERSGTFLKNTNGTFFMDTRGNGGWGENINNGAEGCVDESDPNALIDGQDGTDYSALGDGGSYTFEFNSATNTLNITGAGAYIALPKVANGGDVGVQRNLPSMNTFKVVKLVEGDIADSLHLHHNPDGGDGYWTFQLVSYHDPNDIPELVQLPSAGFSYNATDLTVDFTSTSNAAATNFAWDFGDGNTSTDENPSHTYSAAGNYTVSLTVDDGAGNSDETSQSLTVGIANPAPMTMGHTFESAAGADMLSLFQGNSTIDLGVADPAGGATNVGQFNRVAGTDFQEAIMSFDPASDIDFNNLTTVSIEVYLPSTNDHTGSLNRTVIVGLGDFLVNPSGSWWEDHAQYETADVALDTWVKLEYQLESPNTGANTSDPDTRDDLDMVFINIGGGGHGVGATFYVRNLEFK